MSDSVRNTESRINTCPHCGKYDWACAEGIVLRLKELAHQPHYLGHAVMFSLPEGLKHDTSSCLVSAEWYEQLDALLKLVR